MPEEELMARCKVGSVQKVSKKILIFFLFWPQCENAHCHGGKLCQMHFPSWHVERVTLQVNCNWCFMFHEINQKTPFFQKTVGFSFRLVLRRLLKFILVVFYFVGYPRLIPSNQ